MIARGSLRQIGKVGRRFLHLRVASTPNENALKFILMDKKILPERINGSIQIDNISDAFEISPLAMKLFRLNGVKSIMLGEDFVTVSKLGTELSHSEDLSWNVLQPKVENVISEHVDSGKEVIAEEYSPVANANDGLDTDDDITFEIKELIKTRIQPLLQDDGGDIEFRSFDPDTGVVYVKLQGLCKSCSLSDDTLKTGIEQMLKHYIEEVTEVRAKLDPEEEISLSEFEKLEKRIKQTRL